MLFCHWGALFPVYDGADLAIHRVTDILTLGLVEAPVVLPVLGRHLLQLAAVLAGWPGCHDGRHDDATQQ